MNEQDRPKIPPDELAERLSGQDVSRIPLDELAERCGIALVRVSADEVAGTMPVAGNRQPFGLLHGGASAVLAETLGSVHANVLAGAGAVAFGVELNCTHHRAMTSGSVTGVSTPLHIGRQVSTFHIAISDEAGRAVCTARLTCLARPAGAGPDPRRAPVAGHGEPGTSTTR